VPDRIHYSYTLVFSVEKSNIRWKVTHQFSRFKVLNLLIKKLAPCMIYSKFPKDSTTTLLGLRVSQKAVDNRRLMLDIWIREVVASSEIFPQEIVQSLNDFIKAPKKVTTLCSNSNHATSDNQVLSEAPSSSHSSSKNQLGDSNHSFPHNNVSGVKKIKKSKVEVLVNFITRNAKSFKEKISQWITSNRETISTICVSRTEKLTITGSFDLLCILDSVLFRHFTTYIQLLGFITILNSLVGMVSHLFFGLPSLSPSIVLLIASIVMYLHLLVLDYGCYDYDFATHQQPLLSVQDTLRKFLNSPSLEYTDKIYSFPSFLTHRSKDFLSRPPESTEDSESDSDESEHSGYNPLGDDCDKASHSLHSGQKEERPSLHESLVPGSTYDNVEFNDLSAEARAMYSDRSEIHPLKVRGESYCDDKQKVNPGHAMSKLLLLELYEVEGKDGDRHDHVVSRGAAKRRLQALRTLPEKLFLFVVNFQIPGDPPVSIVSYFGLPMDLIERYPGSSTLKFLKMFERFIDIPRTEKERLEAWGIIDHSIHKLPVDEEANKDNANNGHEKDAEEKNTTKLQTHVASTTPPPSSPDAKRPTSYDAARNVTPSTDKARPKSLNINSQSLTPLTSPKKSRLSSLLSRTNPTLISKGFHAMDIPSSPKSPRSPKQSEISRTSSFSKRTRRSSSVGESATTTAVRRNSNISESDKSQNSSFSADAPDITDKLSKDDSTIFLSSSSTFSSDIPANKTTPNKTTPTITIPPLTPSPEVSPPVVEGGKSSGWKIPSDITWPTAYDKGALPPSDYRNERFKLIPSITLGPWVVKAAVGATPALLGRKVVQRYFRGEDYLEIDIHVGSSIIASQVVGLCRGYAKNMVNDVGIVIQGEHEGELPERMLAVGSLNRININIRQKLD